MGIYVCVFVLKCIGAGDINCV
uniref:Uncharacterized protein n=1 Tax=Arundo donax TaxID=35708 RepID=A0A0A9DQT3_ARUDO